MKRKMRNYAFRGKQKDNGEWVHGYYYLEGGITFIVKERKKNEPSMGYEKQFVEVIPETVGQFTGLTDKKGVMIFEGDIVNVEGDVLEVSWDEFFGWVVSDEEMLGEVNFARTEVIGNIHDNPELLEDKDE